MKFLENRFLQLGSSFVALFILKKYINGGVNYNFPNMDDKVVIVNGANTGIGKSTADEFYKLGATVILACRSKEKTLAAIKEIQ
jgi:NADPH:quinone reductase-like Zn-dependent oxidoreductase